MKLVFAFCTYNRTDQLVKLVTAMRAQDCPVSFVILASYNNQDNTLAVLKHLAREPGANLRYVTEISKASYPTAIGALKCWIMTFWFSWMTMNFIKKAY